MALKTVTPSTLVTVPTTDLLAHVRGSTQDNTLLGAYRSAAVAYVEAATNRAMGATVYRYSMDGFPGREVCLPRSPLTSSTSVSVSYRVQGSTSYTAITSGYWVDADSEPPRVVLKTNVTWPDVSLSSANGFRVQFTAGSTTASNVPAALTQAVRLLVAHWYENRESVVVGTVQAKVAQTVDSLVWAEKVPEFP